MWRSLQWLCYLGYAVEAMQSNVLEAFGSVLGAFGGVLGAFWGQARPAHLRQMVAGWPPGGRRMARYCLGALLGRLGGRRQSKTSKNPTRKRSLGNIDIIYIYIHTYT